ncbi:MAG: class II aldolase/adducin family protein [Bacteroidota bacterium]|nr:class II aldolase/adducin family protein [Bacteroidota bacterium]
MKKEIKELIEISRFYGSDSRFVIAGGGNTSYKNAEKLWVKASGSSLSTITEEEFAVLDRAKLSLMSQKTYSNNPAEREEEVKNDLAEATINKGKRPSVETSMHNVINYAFVVHLHPTIVNGLMCAQNAEGDLKKLFGNRALYVEYTDPGYVLFKKVENSIIAYRTRYGEEPAVIWLQNHGIFVAGDTIEGVKALYAKILDTLSDNVILTLPAGVRATCPNTEIIIPGIRRILYNGSPKWLKVRKNELIKFYYDSIGHQSKIAKPFTPDAIVYCKSNYIFLNDEGPEAVLAQAAGVIPSFISNFGYQPKVLLIKEIGLVSVGDTEAQCDIILDVFEDAMKIAYLSESFGGAHPMTPSQIDFIDHWEVENYRRNVAG